MQNQIITSHTCFGGHVDVNPLDLKLAVASRQFTPQVGSTRPYILASGFDLFQRRSLEDTFETHLI